MDFAGVGIRLTEALNQYTRHEARHLSMIPHPFQYPKDIRTENESEIRGWVEWADLVNCYVYLYPLTTAKAQPRNLILTYVGSDYRDNHERRHRNAENYGSRTQLVTIPDLTKYEGAEWLPIPIPVDEWAAMKNPAEGKPIICQTPSIPSGKHTSDIREILSSRKDIVLKIIGKDDPAEGIPWRICMAHKARARIYLGGFCPNPVTVSMMEAFAMRIPVINHASPENEQTVLDKVGYLPYFDAPLTDLSQAVTSLLSDQSLYQEYADRGYRYVKETHDYPLVAKRFAEICEHDVDTVR